MTETTAREHTALTTLDIIAVGEPNELLAGAIAGYEQRLGGLTTVRTATIPGKPANPQRGEPISEEARLVGATVEAIEQERGGRFPIMLGDHYGDVLTTPELSGIITGTDYLCVIIGGIGGLHDVLPERDITRVSFGRIVLSPSLARVVMLDQVYRALRASSGAPYDLN